MFRWSPLNLSGEPPANNPETATAFSSRLILGLASPELPHPPDISFGSFFPSNEQSQSTGKIPWKNVLSGVQSTGVSQRVRRTRWDDSQSVPSKRNSSTQGICSSHFLKDLSQAVDHTQWETPPCDFPFQAVGEKERSSNCFAG